MGKTWEDTILEVRCEYMGIAYRDGEIKPLSLPTDINLIRPKDILVIVYLDGYMNIPVKDSDMEVKIPLVRSMQLGCVYRKCDRLLVNTTARDGDDDQNDPYIEDISLQDNCLVYLLTDFMLDNDTYKELGEYMEGDRVYLDNFNIRRKRNMSEFNFHIDDGVTLTVEFYNNTSGICFKVDGIEFGNELYGIRSSRAAFKSDPTYTILYQKEMAGVSVQLIYNEEINTWIMIKVIVDESGVPHIHVYEYDESNEAWHGVISFLEKYLK